MSRFRLSAPDKEFNSRVDGLFSCLDEVETQLPSDGLVFDSSTSGIRSSTTRESTKAVKDNDGFKRPMECDIPSNKRFKHQSGSKRNKPDYAVNPEKWTCYQMKDVEELDDAQNKKAALQLFADIKQKTKTETVKVDLEKDKIVFKRPTHRNTAQSSDTVMETETNSSESLVQSDDFGGTKKFVMDEYVVGVKKKNKKNKSKSITSTTKTKDTVQLSYLKFDDDDEDSN